MLFGGERWKLGDELPGRGLLAVYGLVTGLFSSLVGVSGGAISNAVLTLYGRPMHQAVGTSAGVGVPITIAGTIGYMLGRLAAYGAATAIVDRLRITRRFRADGAGIELYDHLWRAVGALAAAAKTGDCLRNIPDPGRAAICRQSDLAAAFIGFRASAACRHAPPSFPVG